MDYQQIYDMYATSPEEISQVNVEKREVKDIERVTLGMVQPDDLLAHIEGDAMHYIREAETVEESAAGVRILHWVGLYRGILRKKIYDMHGTSGEEILEVLGAEFGSSEGEARRLWEPGELLAHMEGCAMEYVKHDPEHTTAAGRILLMVGLLRKSLSG